MVYMKKRKRYIGQRLCVLLAAVLIFAVLIVAYLNDRIDRIMDSVVKRQLEGKITVLINDAVSEVMAEEPYANSEFITMRYSADGKISALSANSMLMNGLRTDISIRIQEKMSELAAYGFDLSYADLIGEGFLSSFLPHYALTVRIESVGAVSTDVTSDFSAAGINQTKHTVALSVEAGATGLVKGKTMDVRISTSVCIAETIIVGEVPLVWLGTES